MLQKWNWNLSWREVTLLLNTNKVFLWVKEWKLSRNSNSSSN
ncbi:hypothetical protein LEP1GSC082_2669 [Leptospira kirschneri str. H2]|nr:hypothetical protein LEP1GSC082_2669 [Leptospira kirschneri str. H2]